ncbi:MAG TPA: stage III sporulation protein AE [Massilibacterium sp.]|nr:stage III sporulation protein AE [Massilibacterium sp.]
MDVKKVILVCFVITCFPNMLIAKPVDPIEQTQKEQIDALPLETLEKEWEEWKKSYESINSELSSFSFSDLIQNSISLKEILLLFVRLFFQEWIAQSKLFITLTLLLLFSSFLKLLHQSFQSTHVQTISYICIFILLFITVFESFQRVIDQIVVNIDTMVSMMITFIPLYLSLMFSTGQVLSATFFHPFLIFFLNIISFLVQKWLVPLLVIAAFLHLFSQLSPHTSMKKLAILLRQIVFTTLSVVFAIVLAVSSIRGATTSVGDGVALKTVKFMTGNFIPVIGKFFQEATDTVFSTSILLKNTIGVAGLLFLTFILISPIIKIAVIAFMYRVVSALLQPIGEEKLVECVDLSGMYIFYFLGLLLFVSFLFFLMISILMISGNIMMMVK